MAIALNHTIIASTDPAASANWLAEVLGLDRPNQWGPFWEVRTGNEVSLDFDRSDSAIHPQHYAFLISEEEFDAVFARLADRGDEHYADPGGQRRGEINRNAGGRGMYFADPNGHWLEVITRPYGSG
ncbi:MAG: VOC family protein [Ilumatobacteraceae bacterium]